MTFLNAVIADRILNRDGGEPPREGDEAPEQAREDC